MPLHDFVKFKNIKKFIRMKNYDYLHQFKCVIFANFYARDIRLSMSLQRQKKFPFFIHYITHMAIFFGRLSIANILLHHQTTTTSAGF